VGSPSGRPVRRERELSRPLPNLEPDFEIDQPRPQVPLISRPLPRGNASSQMSSNFNRRTGCALVPDSPAFKRQKTVTGYTSTSSSAENTAAYNSDIDSGDDLFKDYIPDTPAQATFHTQPTQIIDKFGRPPASRPDTPDSIIEVAASSPLQNTLTRTSNSSSQRRVPEPYQNTVTPAQNLARSMAPAGTVYRAPQVITNRPPTYITIDDDDDDDGPRFQGSSSDEDDDGANIKPSTFAPRSAQSSFATSPITNSVNGNAKFQSIVANAAYKPYEKSNHSMFDAVNRSFTATSASSISGGKLSADSMAMGYGSAKRPQTQLRPERARPVEDIQLDSLSDQKLRDTITRLRAIFPNITVLTAKNALVTSKGSLDDAVLLLSTRPDPTIISDDEVESPPPIKKQEPQMKRVLDAPVISIKDRYPATQALHRPAVTTPPKPKKRLIQGRRHPSSPAVPSVSSPLKVHSSPAVSVDDFDSDSGVASATDEDPELGGRVLKYLNTCSVEDLIELTNVSKPNAELVVAARPFRTLDAARSVANPASLKTGKKRTKAPIGDKIVDTAVDMFSGYEAIDALVAKCEQLGKPLAEEMGRWGFDVFGAAKDGELEMTSFQDDSSSQRDSGIGSPSSGVISVNGDAGDEDIKFVATRKRGPTNYLKQPGMMAEDSSLKDYQVVGLNWLALMYRHKLSCILADEMGLGKTCQVIALLSHLVETGNSGPHLVICPGSTLENWLREFPKFSPKLVVEPYYGMLLRDSCRRCIH
jgi:SWI/SNF-related matrix-associated actin-dependent regulator 1 of chromatin subfamily A